MKRETESERRNMIETGWNHPNSYIKKETDTKGLVTYRGSFVLNSAEFKFSMNQQSSGKYLMRGRVSAISPEDGFVLQVVGAEKKRRLNKKTVTPEQEIDTAPQQDTASVAETRRQKALNITAEVYGQSLEEGTVKSDVERAVLRLYSKYADLIHRRMKISSRPDSITPAIAAVIYADEFVTMNHRSASDSTRKVYTKAIKEHYAIMPNIPMTKMTKAKMKQYLDSHTISANTLRLLVGFWQYCLAKGICIGSNPFPESRKRTLSAAVKQAKAVVPDELSIKMQDQLYEELLAREASGASCGIALMLWGGFSAKLTCGFIWGDILFDFDQPDFVRVIYRQDDKAGATHDFTRPLFPQAARILHKRYEMLAAQYAPEELMKCPIVSTKLNHKKAMTANALTQYAAMLLRTIGVSEDTFMKLKMPKVAVSSRIFLNTYVKNLVQRCGLGDDPGTVNFMMGLSLSGSVTDDHYSSFVSELASRRIFTALKAAGPLENITQPEELVVLEDGREKHITAPENTRQRVGVVADIILQPGEELEIICPHGVSGSIRARAVTEKGLRRKSAKS